MKNNEIIEWSKDLNTYLGNKGYTILKSELSIKCQITLKKMLMIKPFVPGSPIQVTKMFPAYRESDKKIYIPRYFGEELFGPAKTIKITEGDDINLDFQGTLRDYQKPVIEKYLQHVSKGGGGLLELFCGWGKCLKIDTPIIMYDGKIKKVQDVVVGDILMGDDSTPRNVLSLARGREQMYKITNEQGDTYTVNESHILSLKYSSDYKNNKKNEVVDISVKDYLNLPKCVKLLGYKVGIDFPKLNVEIDPYFIGFWIGCEKTNTLKLKLTIKHSSVLKYLIEVLKDKYMYLRYDVNYDYNIFEISNNNKKSFLNLLLSLNLLKTKCIPDMYKHNDTQIRLKLLAGIIDSNGSCNFHKNKKCYEIIEKNNLLSNDIIYLCRSLGFACYSKMEDNKNKIYIYGSNLDKIPILIKSNKYKCYKVKVNKHLLSKIKVEKLSVDNYYGFCIDGNRRFLLGDFTVTHNTDSTLYTIGHIKKKTLIIVHKEFLMNQWIERIHKYYPNARIGKIQGQVIDIDNKDIVLAMLQSISMKDYPSTLFDSFGFTIIDEVHHISSQVFSCALFKLVTKYMLGLSATMNRKDGTTKVFKMFLGDIVYKQERNKDENVVVRGITFQSKDEEFNTTELDFRGQIAASKMLSKICNYNYRSQFIIKVLKDMILENPKQQIMMIASYKNILSYMFSAINYNKICTVGYYVGGMKETALKESESKQVILATYSMAAEGLDIKTLTTLFMITPMTNIEQSVGRILRQKHDFAPVIVDIIDTHDNFRRQWEKRKTFFKKQNYKIIQTSSFLYDSDVSNWKITYEPSKCKTTTTFIEKKNEYAGSRSSSDKSIADDTDSEEETLETKKVGVCLLNLGKSR